jgi:hypothetical protein
MGGMLNTISKKGSSLLEVLMALSLLGITMASLMSLFVASNHFYSRLFPLDVASIRDCIESNDFVGPKSYLSFDSEGKWSFSNTDDGNPVCLVQVQSCFSATVGSYELVEVFPLSGNSAKISKTPLLSYIR